MSEKQERINSLIEPMLKKTLWVIFSTPVSDLEAMMPHMEDHLNWLIELEAEGVLFASGPFLPDAPGGEISGEGMTVVRAADRAEAEALAQQDPFVKAGARTVRVRPWQVNEGMVSVKIHFATGRYTFE